MADAPGSRFNVAIIAVPGLLSSEATTLITEAIGPLLVRHPGVLYTITVTQRRANSGWGLEASLRLGSRSISIHQPSRPTLGAALAEMTRALTRRLEVPPEWER